MKFDVIIIGGGLAGTTAAIALQRDGFRCAMVSAGLSPHRVDTREFRKAGGTLLQGDAVVSGTFDGDTLASVRTGKLGDTPLEARHFILATGKFFSRGVAADMDKVYETIFGLDTQYDTDPDKWYAPHFYNPQPFLEYGVRSEQGCALLGGRRIVNLHPAGEVLAGLSGVTEDADQKIIESAMEAVRIIKGE